MNPTPVHTLEPKGDVICPLAGLKPDTYTTVKGEEILKAFDNYYRRKRPTIAVKVSNEDINEMQDKGISLYDWFKDHLFTKAEHHRIVGNYDKKEK